MDGSRSNQIQEESNFSWLVAHNRRLIMSEFRRRWSYSFAIGLALCLVCLAYIPHWKSYAPRIEQSMPISPYLTPWTVIFVSVLSFALAIIALPFRTPSPIQTIVSKTLGVVVICFATIFLLEYISGIRAPDLDLFFLPDAIGHRVMLYSARPSPHSATTSLLFGLALLCYDRDTKWRVRGFQIGVLTALVLPTIAAIGYLAHFFLALQPAWLNSGLSIPAVILYFTLGSGFLGLSYRAGQSRPVVARPGKDFRRWV
jgi:hypothetical protein